jgi:hypothetical protein
MGRGNWIPDTPIYQGDYDLVYVELQDVCESSPDCDEVEWLYEDFKTNIRGMLPKSFRSVERGERCKYLGRDTVVLFANDLLMVVMDCQGDFWHQGLAVVAREDAPAFAESRIDRLAARLWKGLIECGYSLYRRDTAWTCRPFAAA